MDIIQYTFIVWCITVEFIWKTVVLIAKRDREFHGIGIVEVIWKAVLGLVNCCIGGAVYFHDTLHGFRSCRGKGNVSIEVKLIHHLTTMREEVPYMILLDLRKSYYVLYQERCMEILVRYGIIPRMEKVILINCEQLLMVAQAGQYCGTIFQGSLRVTHVDRLSPNILNMAMDAMIWYWLTLFAVEEAVTEGFIWAFQWLVTF